MSPNDTGEFGRDCKLLSLALNRLREDVERSPVWDESVVWGACAVADVVRAYGGDNDTLCAALLCHRVGLGSEYVNEDLVRAEFGDDVARTLACLVFAQEDVGGRLLVRVIVAGQCDRRTSVIFLAVCIQELLHGLRKAGPLGPANDVKLAVLHYKELLAAFRSNPSVSRPAGHTADDATPRTWDMLEEFARHLDALVRRSGG